jgi:hypothetical protein
MSADAEYCFGKPRAYPTPIEIARLVIAHSRSVDTRAERAAEKLAGIIASDQAIETR